MAVKTESPAVDIIPGLTKVLGVTRTQLAAMLMVTDRSLYDWAGRTLTEMPPKGRRLVRLAQVVHELKREFDVPDNRLLALLNDGRVPVDSDDGKSSSMSLISYITAFPEEQGWRANVRAAVEVYQAYTNRQNTAIIDSYSDKSGRFGTFY